eukprot:CAMPEP_0114992814 /NCGR_PEP_ID=MMETSP0216-20121206/12164_1 /TAXON_ID=223996 /ORGANISM="Protocruzia adherens, Strain Boccale" /LENGTH=320 /DNA_ID=CAMNT_0002356349 /DNA_START=35 /DNA_END=997 /DNA_ORIENTATION=-
MSDRIHTFGDMRNNAGNNNRGGRPAGGGSGPSGGQQGQSQPLIAGRLSNPRNETFWDMLKFNFCPTFSIRSFIFIVSILDIVMYIATLAYDGVDKEGDFLEPTNKALDKFGQKDPYKMKHDPEQVYRWFMPMFLHEGLAHIMFNLISQMIFGFWFEALVGTVRVAAVYLVGGIGGILFSALVSNSNSVGASTAIFAILGGMLAWLLLNWFYLDPNIRCQMSCILIVVLLLNFLFTLGATNVDNYGHLGGLMTGFFVGLSVLKYPPGEINMFGLPIPQYQDPHANPDRKWEKYWQISGYVCSFMFYVGGFVLFYTVRHPDE